MFTKSLFAASFIAALALPVCAYAADAGGEIATAGTHASLAAGAADINGVHMHLHHAVNCLVGPKGAEFDAKNMNPCANSGDGAIPDTMDAAKKAKLQGAVKMAEAGIAATDVDAAKKDASDAAAAITAAK